MDAHWYIDALDARAGRAFVSFRPKILDTAEDLDASQQSFYIAPASFEPEPVAGPSIGMSSTRGTFQSGLYDGEGAVPFPSLASVIDFVRRAYLSGGGNAEPDGEGPPEPPEEPPPESPEGEGPLGLYQINSRSKEKDSRSESGDLVAATKAQDLLNKLLKFEEVTEKIERGKSKSFDFNSVDHSSVGGSGYQITSSERLIRAATWLWLDLLYREPLPTDDARKRRRWRLSMSVFTEMFKYFCLHEFFLVNNREVTFPSYPYRRYYEKPIFAWSNAYMRSKSSKISVSCLYDLPVPMAISTDLDFGSVGRENATLFNFMSVCCATPSEVFATCEDVAIQQARFDLLFLVACIVVAVEPDLKRPVEDWIFSKDLENLLYEEIEDWHNALAEKALRWLSANLPEFAFEKSIEKWLVLYGN